MNALHRTWEKLISQTLTEAEQIAETLAPGLSYRPAGGMAQRSERSLSVQGRLPCLLPVFSI